jgi:predicted Zn-dependent protease
MLGKEKCLDIYNVVKSFVKAPQFEVLIIGQEESLTRYANSVIHQNVRTVDANVQLRVVSGKKTGISSTNDLSRDGLADLVKTAMEIMGLSEEDPDFLSLPEPQKIEYPSFDYFDSSLQFDSEDYKAQVISTICVKSKNYGLKAFGRFSTSKMELFVGNSLGVEAFTKSSEANLNVQIMGEGFSGFAQSTSKFISDLEIERAMNDAIETCLMSRNPTEIEPGDYKVILKPEATEDIIEMLNYMGFSCNAISEGRSFLSGKLGEKIFGENISIIDDGLDKRGIIMPFDFEGIPKQRVEIIKNGIFKDFVTDSKWAHKLGRRNTGHALPAPNTFGPIPINIIFSEGIKTLEEMISETDEAILITHFWYSNPINPKIGLATGLTRDGTFLVRNGKIERPVKNLRYTDSLVSLLSNVLAVGTKLRLCERSLVPAIECKSLKFTSVAPSQ